MLMKFGVRQLHTDFLLLKPVFNDDRFFDYLTTLFICVDYRPIKWMTNWKGFRRKRLLHILRYSRISWRDFRKPRKHQFK